MGLLEIQKYLMDKDKTINDLKREFNIEVYEDESLPLVLFNYTIFSPMYHKIVQESRGLILEKGSWDVVCRSLTAFFYEEDYLAKNTKDNFNWNSAKAFVKYDGALMFVYAYRGVWYVGCRMHPTAQILAGSVAYSDYTRKYEDVFKGVLLSRYGLTWKDFTDKLIQGYSYSFEVYDKDLRVGILYPKPYIKLLCVRDQHLNEVDIYQFQLGVDVPDCKPVRSMDEVRDYVQSLEGDHEGVVLCDDQFNRLKIRTQSYGSVVLPKMAQTSLLQNSEASSEVVDFLTLYAPDFFMLAEADTSPTPTTTIAEADNAPPPEGLSVGPARIMSAEKPIVSVVALVEELSNLYSQYKDLDDKSFEYVAELTPWKGAMMAMRRGQSVVEYLDEASTYEIYEAIQNYQQKIIERGKI